ncbi:MAG: SCO family protein [Deltaproteobacteria bacterium]|nr:SCO family protein [Deltaproteobacteria bacterium]
MNIRKIFLNPFVVAFLFGILGLHLIRTIGERRFPPPPPLVEVPAWQLIDQNEKPYGTQQLTGKVVIADFFFTRCPTICPQLTRSMKEVQKRFLNHGDKAAFVSISIDPDFDTPSVLREYRSKNETNWIYLTGKKEEILEVVEGKMKLAMGSAHHVAELVLFDQNGNLRAKFGTDPTSLAALEKAAKYFIEHPVN